MNLTEFISSFTNVTEKPHRFLSVQEEAADKVKILVKNVYDYTKDNESESSKRTLPQLIIQDFDDEQIWQELELQNQNCASDLIQVLPELSAKQEKLRFPLALKCLKEEKSTPSLGENFNVKISQDTKDMLTDEEYKDEDEDKKDDVTNEFMNQNSRKKSQRSKPTPSIVDDKFFKLSELELFLNNEDRNYDKPRKDTDAMDLFDKNDDTAADYKYSDFFDNPDDEGGFHEEGKYENAEEEVDNEEFEDEEEKGEDSNNISDGDGVSDEENQNEDNLEIDDDQRDSSQDKSNKRKPSTDADDDSDVDDIEEPLKARKSKKVRFSLLDDETGESDEEMSDLSSSKKKKKDASEGLKSSLERRQDRLGQVIEQLEEEAISEKPWQLKGEVGAGSRPENSLLEEIVDFDLSVRPAPVITGEVSVRLEDIIKQRIKDKAWDDVERKVKPVESPAEFKKKLALDQEKSKLSLAQVYEQEYVRQREAATADDTERQEKEPALHTEVKSLMSTLFNKLDALSDYHYTPRPVAPELKVVTNARAIAMEEVAPVSVADSALLAPQEIAGRKRHTDLMSKDERTKTDMKRERRSKKAKQRQRQRDKEKMAKDVAKINPGLGNKYSKLKAAKQLSAASLSNVTKMDETKEKTVRSSTAFFNKLQDEVKSQIKSKTSFSKKKDKTSISAKKLKL